MADVSILGCGSWGTALGIHLAKKGLLVNMWSKSKDEIYSLDDKRENRRYLPDINIPDNVFFTYDLKVAIRESENIVVAVPSHAVREVLEEVSKHINNQIIINAAKGLENDTLFTMSQVSQQVLPDNKYVALYGPSHAEEVALDIPTTIVAASKDNEAAETVQDIFMAKNFRVYTNPDVIGVEIGGSIKNIIALCAGISDGLGYGDNTKAALMTRGLAEISRLGNAMGADPLTFSGLSGIGDLIVTCTSMYSRNRRFGILLGKNKSAEEALKEIDMVVEGINTTKSAYSLAQEYNVDMPITTQAYEILFNEKNPKIAVHDLMRRDKKQEIK